MGQKRCRRNKQGKNGFSQKTHGYTAQMYGEIEHTDAAACQSVANTFIRVFCQGIRGAVSTRNNLSSRKR
jgi:hypothetical protein